jgi:hypothetical protein
MTVSAQGKCRDVLARGSVPRERLGEFGAYRLAV